MRVLLISANREQTPYPVFPIGLAYLVPPLAAAGHQLEALDLCFEKDPEQAVQAALDRFVPEVLAYLDGDYGIVGEGEETVPTVIAALQEGQVPGPLPGLVLRGAESFLPPRTVSRIVAPDRGLFHLERYDREGGMANLQTKRGCPFACVYCTYPLLEGKRVRLRPIPEIIAELDELVNRSGIDYVYFVDDIFNYPPEFALELCQAITDARLSVKWSAFINPGFIDRLLLEGMVAAGCDAVEFGSDSGSPVMLKNLGKSFGVAEIRSASLICRDLGVDFAHYILFGGPGENEETIAETFALMDEVDPTAVIAMTGVRIFPGTALYRRALEEGVVASDVLLLEPVFYISPLVGERLGPLVTGAARKRRNWIAPGLEVNMSETMLGMLRQFRVRGPLWKQVKRLSRSHVHPMSTQ